MSADTSELRGRTSPADPTNENADGNLEEPTPGIEVEEHDTVLLARLHTGPHGLLVNPVTEALVDLVDRAEHDDRVRGVVLTGTYPGRFVAHADVGWLAAGAAMIGEVDPQMVALADRAAGAAARSGRLGRLADLTSLAGLKELVRFHETLLRMNASGAVFVAALNGSALGGGHELVLACDQRIMARGDYIVGQPEVLLGFPPGGGGTQRLARLVGSHRALEIVLDGRGLSPDDALTAGLVDAVVPADALIGSALARAAHFAGRDKDAVGACKRAIYFGGSETLEAGLRRERAEFIAALATANAQAVSSTYQGLTEQQGDLPAYLPALADEAWRTGSFPTHLHPA